MSDGLTYSLNDIVGSTLRSLTIEILLSSMFIEASGGNFEGSVSTVGVVVINWEAAV